MLVFCCQLSIDFNTNCIMVNIKPRMWFCSKASGLSISKTCCETCPTLCHCLADPAKNDLRQLELVSVESFGPRDWLNDIFYLRFSFFGRTNGHIKAEHKISLSDASIQKYYPSRNSHWLKDVQPSLLLSASVIFQLSVLLLFFCSIFCLASLISLSYWPFLGVFSLHHFVLLNLSTNPCLCSFLPFQSLPSFFKTLHLSPLFLSPSSSLSLSLFLSEIRGPDPEAM